MASNVNDNWHQLSPPAFPDVFVPSEMVSVIIPYYMALDNLRLVIAALHNQTYPQHLMEIIVVDDGSEPPLSEEDIPDGIRIIRQERRGRGKARARHAGAMAAMGSILVFTDGDIVLHPYNIMEHAMWHNAGCHVFSIGSLLAVDTGQVNVYAPDILARLIDGDESIPHHRLEWHKNVCRWTQNFTVGDGLFSFVAGYNYAVDRDMYQRWDLGKYSERFMHWGFEDSYVAYRAHAQGAVFVPVTNAKCWHIGIPTLPSDMPMDVKLNSAIVEQLVPHPFTRHPTAGRVFEVPKYVITLRSENADILLAVVSGMLAGPDFDGIIRLDMGDMDADSAQYVRMRLDSTPSVVFDVQGESIDVFPDSPWHIDISTMVPLQSMLIQRIRNTLETTPGAGQGFRAYGGQCDIVVASSRYLHQKAIGLSVDTMPLIGMGRFTSRKLKHMPVPMHNMHQYIRRKLLMKSLFRRIVKRGR